MDVGRVDDSGKPVAKRVLDPISRIAEILFGLIMALTFTGSLSAASAGREEVRTMLFGAIGCNIAWGLVDAVMYLVTRLTERGREISTLGAIRASGDAARRRGMISGALPERVASILTEAEVESIRTRLVGLSDVPVRARLGKVDFLGALGTFLLVVLSTFPVVIPFLFMQEATQALRVSNGIAVAMLFLCGFELGKYSNYRPWVMGISMAIIGTALVLLTIALGG